MYSSLISLRGGVTRRVSLALTVAAALAACDSDRAVSPTSTSPKLPTAASAASVPGGRGTLMLTSVHGDMTQINVGGASYNVILTTGDTIKVTDNGYGDSDASLGRVSLVNAPAGTYTACPLTAPTGYDLPYTFCVTTTVKAGSGANLGFLAYPLVSLWWETIRPVGDHVGGGIYSVVGQRGLVPPFTVADNGQNDLDPMPGRINAKIPVAGTYQVCELMPPPNSFPATQTCQTVNNSGGRAKWVGYFVNQEKQVFKP